MSSSVSVSSNYLHTLLLTPPPSSPHFPPPPLPSLLVTAARGGQERADFQLLPPCPHCPFSWEGSPGSYTRLSPHCHPSSADVSLPQRGSPQAPQLSWPPTAPPPPFRCVPPHSASMTSEHYSSSPLKGYDHSVYHFITCVLQHGHNKLPEYGPSRRIQPQHWNT